jgi:hypothetical protein
MTDETEPSQSQAPEVESPTGEPERVVEHSVPAERSHPDRRGQSSDDRRRKRGSGQERKSPTGYGDGIERAICMLFRHIGPATFPVQSRQGLATSRPTEVARRPDSVLLCDRNHEGDCLWPDGSLAFIDELAHKVINPSSKIDQLVNASAQSAETIDDLEFSPSPQLVDVDPAEQPTSSEPEASGGDEERDGSGVSDEDRSDDW